MAGGISQQLAPLFFHLLIIISVFDIHFKSPIVSVPDPSSPKFEGPARRVVLFVSDGLRAQSFFQPDVAPFLHQMGLSGGAVGISHTQVPTESRPGHVALLAGLYEDPSAIMKGWSENPVDFDSVLNRSSHAWAWGSPDILPMFAKGSARNRVNTVSYDPSFEDFGHSDASYLDSWVFEKVEDFFEGALQDPDLQLRLRASGNVFFLHLLGCDTNGHTNKPHSAEYNNNIRLVDKGISKVVQAVERYFREDRRTAYVFTADHGMTDWGSHGTGMDEETMTPFVAWGAGLRPLHKIHHPTTNSFNEFFGPTFREFTAKTDKVDIRQADLAPLLSTLIGRSIPVNSVGVLPHRLLDLHPRDLAAALENQFDQLLAQYVELRRRHEEDIYLPAVYHTECPQLTRSHVETCRFDMTRSVSQTRYNQSIETALSCIKRVQQGIHYYQRYQQGLLKGLITLAILFSLLSNLVVVIRLFSSPGSCNIRDCNSVVRWPSCYGDLLELGLAALLVVSWWCQQLPHHFLLYYTAPVYSIKKLREAVKGFDSFPNVSKDILLGLGMSLLIGQSLVFAFTDRRWLSFGVVLLGFSFYHRGCNIKLVALALLLGIFPWLPAIDGRGQLTACVLFTSVLFGITVIFTFHADCRLKLYLVCSNLTAGVCVYLSSSGLSVVIQCCTWFVFLLSVPLALWRTSHTKWRVISLLYSLGACYTLLSLSYEALFLLTLFLVLILWSQDEMVTNKSAMDLGKDCGDNNHSENVAAITRFFFLVFFSFFATGNIASLNSFDPSSIRCFVSVFNPFLMGGLIFIKILIPILSTGISFCYIIQLRGIHPEAVFALLQMFTNFLGLQFFHAVTSSGSWLDIGTSLSHFIIVEGTSLFLFLLLGVSSFLISLAIPKKISYD